MNLVSTNRYTTPPAAWIPRSVNYVAVSDGIMEVYVADANGVPRRIFNEDDVITLIDAAIAAAGGVQEVADIAARDALTPEGVVQVYVRDAADDLSVGSGGAFYLYRPSDMTWKKTGEEESLDLVLEWDSISGRPNSSPAAIDNAVGNSHAHSNMTELDKIGEDADGEPTYSGSRVRHVWGVEAW